MILKATKTMMIMMLFLLLLLLMMMMINVVVVMMMMMMMMMTMIMMIMMMMTVMMCLTYSSFNPCPGEPKIILFWKTLQIQISWLLTQPSDQDLHCFPYP